MQLAGVGVFSELREKMTPQRLASIAAVIVLHVILILVLLEAGIIVVPPLVREPRETTIYLQPPKSKPQPKPQSIEPNVPTVIRPLPDIDEILRKLREWEARQPSSAAPAYNGLRAFGQYMYNCSGALYDMLSREGLDQCLGQYLPKHVPAIGLGAEKPSFWQTQRDEARAPEAPFEEPCPQGSFNDSLHIPCHHFSGSAAGVSGPLVTPKQ